MRFDDADEQDVLLPSDPGPKVFLVGKPQIIKGDKGDSIEWTFRSTNPKRPAQVSLRLFDIFNQKEDTKENLKTANKRQFFSLLAAFMDEESQDILQKGDFNSMEEMVAAATKLWVEDYNNVEAQILFGYGPKGYLQFPGFGSVISTPLRERNLIFNPNSISLKPGKRKPQNADEEKDVQYSEDI